MTTEDAHLAHLALRGHTAASVYARKRALIRLAAWLEATAGAGRRTEQPGKGGYPYMTHCRENNARQPLPATGKPGHASVDLLLATSQDLAAWRASLTAGPGAVVAYVSHVKCFYDWCVDEGLLDQNPAARLPVPRLGRRLPRPIGEDDLMAALDSAPRRIRLMIVLAAWCGLRAKELALLRRECILDTASPPVLLVEARAAKGGRTERIIPLSSSVLGELRIACLPPVGYVFRRMDGRAGPNEAWRISQLCNRHLHRHGIQATLHQLRHRAGTMAYRHDHDLLAVQRFLGHASSNTTQGYAAFDQPSLVAAVEAIPAPGRLRSVAG